LTTNYHTALASTDSANAETMNSVIRQLDQQMNDMDDGAHNFSAIDIDGGAIDGTTIGGTTPAAGAFTDLAVTGNLNFGSAFLAGISHPQSVAATTEETVEWNYIYLDSDSALDLSHETGAYTFTPTQAGYYFMTATVRLDTSAAGTEYRLRILKVGVEYWQAYHECRGTAAESITVSALVQANGTSNAFSALIYNGAAGVSLVQDTPGESYFFGVRMY
jgi:hypothetical protein